MKSLKILDRDGTVVEQFDVSDRSTREIDRMERGMLINLDHDRYTVLRSED